MKEKEMEGKYHPLDVLLNPVRGNLEADDLPEIPNRQKVKFGILCALEVYREKKFVQWAENWLSGKDRSLSAAQEACWAAVWIKQANARSDRIWFSAQSASSAGWAAFKYAEVSGYSSSAVSLAVAEAARDAVKAAKAAGRKLDLAKLAEEAVIDGEKIDKFLCVGWEEPKWKLGRRRK